MSNSVGNSSSMWSNLCTPAKLYGFVSLISVAGLLVNGQVSGAVGQGIFAALWVFVLGWICSKGWSGLSWFLVLLPVILVVILIMAGAASILVTPSVSHEEQHPNRSH